MGDPVMMTQDQFQQLLANLTMNSALNQVPTSPPMSGNFSKCLSRFSGAKDDDVEALMRLPYIKSAWWNNRLILDLQLNEFCQLAQFLTDKRVTGLIRKFSLCKTTERIMSKAEKRFNAILQKSKNLKIPCNQLYSLDVVQKMCKTNESGGKKKYIILGILMAILFSYLRMYKDSECLIEMPSDSSKIFREPETCDICVDTYEVPKIRNLSRDDFENLFVIPGKPLVVTDATKDWLAAKMFSFEFFKKLYDSIREDDYSETDCQFFPYKTEFKSLKEALNMTIERSRLEPGTLPWYIGWSNCNNKAGNILRKYYDRPYFLSNKSESIALSWIFMGGPGFGAHMHVDNVQYPSWQAQLRGTKLWKLAPPPECLYKCRQLEVTVAPGEIIVVDTNRWYHQTFVLPGGISITIGAEFD
ncbi:hypothetical protein FQR65_LT07500 [Abscondita terminalis]|nr:hypothetical protein FQR65_LT07500 [Abscondita terminalis]